MKLIGKKLKKKDKEMAQRQFKIFLFLFLSMLGTLLFWVSFHNIDLLINYSMWTNDFNQKLVGGDKLFNLRDIEDCTIANHCPDFKTIYLRSVFMLFLSHSALVLLITYFVLEKWIKKSKSQ